MRYWMNWLKGRFFYAFQGLYYGVAKDRSIRLQAFLGLAALGAGMLLQIDKYDWLWILLAITLVFTAEVINSCIEKTVDYISMKRDPRAKMIKDMAAAAVLIVSMFALITGCIIFIPKLIEVLR